MLGARHPDLITAYRGLAALREVQGRRAEAVAIMRKSLALALATIGPDHASTATSHFRLGRMLAVDKHYLEAEQQLLRARDVRTKAFGPDAAPTKETVVELTKLHEMWDKPEKAKALTPGAGK